MAPRLCDASIHGTQISITPENYKYVPSSLTSESQLTHVRPNQDQLRCPPHLVRHIRLLSGVSRPPSLSVLLGLPARFEMDQVFGETSSLLSRPEGLYSPAPLRRSFEIALMLYVFGVSRLTTSSVNVLQAFRARSPYDYHGS